MNGENLNRSLDRALYGFRTICLTQEEVRTEKLFNYDVKTFKLEWALSERREQVAQQKKKFESSRGADERREANWLSARSIGSSAFSHTKLSPKLLFHVGRQLHFHLRKVKENEKLNNESRACGRQSPY
jgi:hypothetical protein